MVDTAARRMEQPVTTRYLQRPEGRIAYDVRGSGPLVICLPGMGDVRSSYRFLAPQLAAAGYRVATMDLRGHGDSDVTFTRYDDVAAGTDVLALIRALGTPAVVIGNSMGAGGAAWAAAESPAAVAGLVLVAPFVRDAPTPPAMRLAFRLAIRKPWGPALWGAYYARLYPGRPPADLDEHRARIRSSLRRPGGWAAFAATTRTSHAPVEARLDEVAAPALTIMGAADPDWPDPAAEAGVVVDRLGGDLLLIPEAGHYPHAEYPEIVGPAITAFLRRALPSG